MIRYIFTLILITHYGICLGQAGRPIDTTGQSEKIKNAPMDTMKTGEGENTGVNKDYNKPQPEKKSKPDNTRTQTSPKAKVNENVQPTTLHGTPIQGETVEVKKNSQNYHGTNPLHVDTTINKAPANQKIKTEKKERKEELRKK